MLCILNATQCMPFYLQVCEWREPEELAQLLDLELRATGESRERLLQRVKDVAKYSVKTGKTRTTIRRGLYIQKDKAKPIWSVTSNKVYIAQCNSYNLESTIFSLRTSRLILRNNSHAVNTLLLNRPVYGGSLLPKSCARFLAQTGEDGDASISSTTMSGRCVYGCQNRYSTVELKFYRTPTISEQPAVSVAASDKTE